MTKIRMRDFAVRILIFCTGAFLVFSCGKPPAQENIYGVWKGESKGVELVFKFFDNGTCELNFENTASGSTEVLKGNLEIDFTKEPLPLTVRNIPRLSHPLHTIVDFINEDSIRIAHFATRWRLRPISFDQNTSMNLRRVDGNPQAEP